MNLTQIKITDWPKGLEKPVAALRHEPADLEAMCNLQFEDSTDDLGTFKVALVQPEGGHAFALVRYAHNALPGTNVLVSVASAECLNEVLAALNLQLTDCTWQSPWLVKAAKRISQMEGRVS